MPNPFYRNHKVQSISILTNKNSANKENNLEKISVNSHSIDEPKYINNNQLIDNNTSSNINQNMNGIETKNIIEPNNIQIENKTNDTFSMYNIFYWSICLIIIIMAIFTIYMYYENIYMYIGEKITLIKETFIQKYEYFVKK